MDNPLTAILKHDYKQPHFSLSQLNAITSWKVCEVLSSFESTYPDMSTLSSIEIGSAAFPLDLFFDLDADPVKGIILFPHFIAAGEKVLPEFFGEELLAPLLFLPL